MLYQRGKAVEAEAAFRRTMALDPGNLDALQNLGAVLVDQGKHRAAQPHFDAVLSKDPDFELAWAGLANVHRALGNQSELLRCLERAVALNPNNAATKHLLLAARGQTPRHPDWRYVEDFFDDYAARFETYLVERLDYSAPTVLVEFIKSAFPDAGRFPAVLDLGCGTGLLAAALRAAYDIKHMVGVDLSQRMVTAAVARGLYAEVIKAEAEDYLHQSHQTFDLIGATDVFIYVGDVADIFEFSARRLNPGGVFAFTVEPIEGSGFVPQSSGRFGHSPEYLKALADTNGF